MLLQARASQQTDANSKQEACDWPSEKICERGMLEETNFKPDVPWRDHSNRANVEGEDCRRKFVQEEGEMAVSGFAFKLAQKPRSLRKNSVKKRTWGLIDVWKGDCSKSSKYLVADRTIRQSRKRTRKDLASDGDMEWEAVTGESIYYSSDRKQSSRPKTQGGLNLNVQELNGEIAAVTAGLQADMPGPAERIWFKDVLRRRGGLQEYLECRNLVLGLWERDVRQNLCITDCGLSPVASSDETPRESLLRAIYHFLTYHGYINIGIVSKPCKLKSGTQVSSCNSVPETADLNGNSSVDKDSQNGSSEQGSLLHKEQTKIELVMDYTISMNEAVVTDPSPMDIDEKPSIITKNRLLCDQTLVEDKISPAAHCGDEESLLDIANRLRGRSKKKRDALINVEKIVKPNEEESVRGIGNDQTTDAIAPTLTPTVENQFSSRCNEKVGSGQLQTVPAALMFEIKDASLSCKDGVNLNEDIHVREKHGEQQTIVKKENQAELCKLSTPDILLASDWLASTVNEMASPKVVIVGAGPAGLTAGKHLQNLNLSVTVLEARERVGGRVFTDRTRLSGPVDLGASIITGVEADVSSERRPDPTALLCRQLDLELTTLGGDCPLFDLVAGAKVPTDIDEALEAEYNSLLDDTVMLVAQSGDVAMQMSLEEGLELSLKRRKEQEKRSFFPIRNTECLSGKLKEFEQNIHATRFNEARVPSINACLSSFERRVMDWHFANLEYGCAAELNQVSLPYWNQDDVYGGFAGPHCMIKGGYGTVMEALAEGLPIHFKRVVTRIEYTSKDEDIVKGERVKVYTSSGEVFMGDAVLVTIPLGCLKLDSIEFIPSLPGWKTASIQRLGFGVLNKVIMEFPVAFWDENIDFFGATAQDTHSRGRCFMFWNLKRTVGAPVLSALVVGKAALEEEEKEDAESVEHALVVLRSIFGEASVPQPTGYVVTKWGSDPYSRGAYSYVAKGASGEDYDIIGRSVENCVFFAGEATCKEHPDTVGGAIMTGLREAVRIMDVLFNRVDSVAEAEAMAAAERQSDTERNEVRDMTKRLNAAELSIAIRKDGGILDEDNEPFNKAILLQDMFGCAQTTPGRLLLAKEMLQLPASALEAFAGTRKGLTILNSWIQDSLGKDATQLLRHCVRLLLVVGKDLPSVRQSGIGRTVKEKVVVHTSRDIRAIAGQLVKVWVETFKKEKAAGKIGRPLHQPPIGVRGISVVAKISQKNMKCGLSPMNSRVKVLHAALVNNVSKQLVSEREVTEPNSSRTDSKDMESERETSVACGSNSSNPISDSEAAAMAAAEAAVAAATAAAKAFKTAEASSSQLELPKILSFHRFANKREQTVVPEPIRRKSIEREQLLLHGRDQAGMGVDARNCKVRDWSIDFTHNCTSLHSPNVLFAEQGIGDDQNSLCIDNCKGLNLVSTQEKDALKEVADVVSPVPLTKEKQQKESSSVSGLFSVRGSNTCSSEVVQRPNKSSADSDSTGALTDVKDHSKDCFWVAKSTSNDEEHLSRCSEHKKAVTDYVSSLLIPLYKTRKIDKDGFKSLVKKSAVKVIERQTKQEAALQVSQFLDTKRKIKIRTLVDKFVERFLENSEK